MKYKRLFVKKWGICKNKGVYGNKKHGGFLEKKKL